MPKPTPDVLISNSDPALLKKLEPIKRFCLLAVAIIAMVTLLGWYLPALGKSLPNGWTLMTAETALGLLLGAFSLELSDAHYSIRVNRLSQLLALLTALLGMAILAEYMLHISAGLERLFPFNPNSTSPWPDRPSPQTAAGLALLGITTAMIRVRGRIVVRIAELFAICLGLLVLALVSGEMFGALRIVGISAVTRTSPQTLFCFAILTFVAFLRRSETGVFSIFLGRGIGGKIARALAPVLLVVPVLREIGRARIIESRVVPEQYATAILATIATMISVVLLMFIAWRINSMELEIHDLTLRDELTGLFNLRGFNLLAEQALRLAHRSQQPFSVLFLDLDNLKKINDTFGHNEGSRFLTEASQLLKATFRETDVIGRVGGDEFAVAGNFNSEAIAACSERLRQASELRNAEARWFYPLNFSIGYVTSDDGEHVSLKELLARADDAMYEEKRRKKLVTTDRRPSL